MPSEPFIDANPFHHLYGLTYPVKKLGLRDGISRRNSPKITPEMPFPLAANCVFAKHACQTCMPEALPRSHSDSFLWNAGRFVKVSKSKGRPVKVLWVLGSKGKPASPWLSRHACPRGSAAMP